MDTESVLALGRVFERISIVIVAALSLWMGWILYVKGVDKKQEAEIQHDKTILKLKDVGPGAFFAIVGAVVLMVSLGNSLRLEGLGGKEDNKKVVSYGGTLVTDPSPSDLITAVTSLNATLNEDTISPDIPWKRRAISEALSKLSAFRSNLLRAEFRDYPIYLRIQEQENQGIPVPAQEKEKIDYLKIDAVATRTFGHEQ